MRKSLMAGLTTVALVLGACENVDSSDILTSGMYADISATANGDGETLVKTSLRVGGAASNTFVDLVGDDKLEATTGEESKDMQQKELLKAIWYEASFNVDAADTEFKVAFNRTVDDGAPESTMTLPAGFNITAPAASADFSRENDEINITWETSGSSDNMLLNVDGHCIKLHHKDISGDSGSYTIPAQKLVAHEDHADETCSITLQLIRRRTGTLDEGYGEGGVVLGQQVREIKVNSTP